MTSFSRILGQSLKVKFYKVKLLKFKTFIFDQKFCWNGHFSIMKKLWDLKKFLSYLELDGQGRGIIMEVTGPLLLGPSYYVFSYATPNISAASVSTLTDSRWLNSKLQIHIPNIYSFKMS